MRIGELLRVFDEIQDWALVQRTAVDRGGIGYVPSHIVVCCICSKFPQKLTPIISDARKGTRT